MARVTEPDEQLAYELVLYIDNEGALYPQKQSIQANLIKKILAGKYDKRKALQLWSYLVEAGAKKYHKEFGYDGKWNDVFDTATRKAAAERMASEFEAEYESGELEHITEKVRPKGKRKNPEHPIISYEVHWARANRADEMSAMRAGARRHDARESAEAEARSLWGRTPRPDLVPIVVEVATYPAPKSKRSNPVTPTSAVKSKLMR